MVRKLKPNPLLQIFLPPIFLPQISPLQCLSAGKNIHRKKIETSSPSSTFLTINLLTSNQCPPAAPRLPRLIHPCRITVGPDELVALIDATKHPQVHGHPTICQTAAQIAPVLSKEMMATPTISLAMMSLMRTLAKDDSEGIRLPREALLKRLDEVASKEWLTVLKEK